MTTKSKIRIKLLHMRPYSTYCIAEMIVHAGHTTYACVGYENKDRLYLEEIIELLWNRICERKVERLVYD